MTKEEWKDEEIKWWINYLEERKKFWQDEIRIADRKMFLLSQELNCKEEIGCVTIVTESRQYTSLKGNRLYQYMALQESTEIIVRIECRRCQKDIQKVIVGFPEE